ncbi:MAG: hypothetical protein V4489_02710 [Chlamydiota bacterium]
MLKHRDRKLSILHQLEQAAEPTTLAELVSRLEFDCSDRTVRRLLTKLISEDLVQKLGHTKGALYVAVKVPGTPPGRQILATEGHLGHALERVVLVLIV